MEQTAKIVHGRKHGFSSTYRTYKELLQDFDKKDGRGNVQSKKDEQNKGFRFQVRVRSSKVDKDFKAECS